MNEFHRYYYLKTYINVINETSVQVHVRIDEMKVTANFFKQ